jgi:hypothetical protein
MNRLLDGRWLVLLRGSHGRRMLLRCCGYRLARMLLRRSLRRWLGPHRDRWWCFDIVIRGQRMSNGHDRGMRLVHGGEIAAI